MALCARVETVAAANPAATTRERRIEFTLDIIFLTLLFCFGINGPAQAGTSNIENRMREAEKCSTTRSKNCDGFYALQGLARRKNCCGPEMIFVTVFCPLTTTGARETGVQTVGARRFVVDCKVNPAILVGHAKIIEFDATAPDPAGLRLTASTGAGGGDTSEGENAAVLSPAVP